MPDFAKAGIQSSGAGSWPNATQIEPKNYCCSYCDSRVASNLGWVWKSGQNQVMASLYICPLCHGPSYFDSTEKQTPGVIPGKSVNNVPRAVDGLYDEARRCAAAGAPTAAAMACRKILMNVAVEKGADQGKKFIEYVNYFESHHYIPPDGKSLVDYIRTFGNEAVHEIKLGIPGF